MNILWTITLRLESPPNHPLDGSRLQISPILGKLTIKIKMQPGRLSCPLFDTSGFVSFNYYDDKSNAMFKHVEQLVWVSGLEIIDVGRIALTGGRHSPGITTSSEHLNLFFASADVLDIGHTHGEFGWPFSISSINFLQSNNVDKGAVNNWSRS